MRWDNDGPQCTATNRQKKRCGNAPIPGGTVCGQHGGKAPQVQRSAALRLIALVDPAIARLAHIIDHGDSDHVRLRAAENVLDRAGYPRRVTTDSDTARDLLIQRLLEVQAERTRVPEILEGVIVDEEPTAI